MATLKRPRSTEPDAQHSKKHPRLYETQAPDGGRGPMVETASKAIQSPQPATRREEILQNGLAALTKVLQRQGQELNAKNFEIASLRSQLAERNRGFQESLTDRLAEIVSQKVDAMRSHAPERRERAGDDPDARQTASTLEPNSTVPRAAPTATTTTDSAEIIAIGVWRGSGV
ncbi:hypothetical protein D9611_012333 [Ephemerocybe angulata]|uniref:Uncharacterized protein n=1 Tax=Ephemerocybe angulata TaxID=980116 RepID=A0A8H5CEH6_9AGAR|nr:hypothetical protein D9611_012333 [Tulosesus angulatus]